MKQLLIMRHAKSDWSSGVMDDINRPLNKRGLHDAPIMGAEVLKRNMLPDMILSSPAERAKQTAILFAESCRFPGEIVFESDLYFGHFNDVFYHLKNIPDNVNRLMIIGHNPTFEQLVTSLLLNIKSDIVMPTAGIVALTAGIQSWKNLELQKNNLVWFITPKLLKEKKIL